MTTKNVRQNRSGALDHVRSLPIVETRQIGIDIGSLELLAILLTYLKAASEEEPYFIKDGIKIIL